MSERSGTVLVIAMIVLSTGGAWLLVYGARIAWFRERLLHGDRTQRMVALLPIVVPAYMIAALLIVPALS